MNKIKGNGMKVERWMSDPAGIGLVTHDGLNGNYEVSHSGITKLEWMAGIVASGELVGGSASAIRQPSGFGKHVVDLAAHILTACHEAEKE